MELEAIFHEWEHGKPAAAEPEGYVNPAAMDAWRIDSIEARQEMKAGAFE
jgi:hypothetical protein